MNQEQPSTSATMSGLETLSSTNLMLENPSQDIRGHTVVDASGEKLGKVDELMVDSVQHMVRFLQVGSGGFLGVGREHVLIPVDAIESVTDDLVRINHTSQRVIGSPEYAPDLVTNEDFYRRVYDYYGYKPYWNSSDAHQRQGLTEQEGGYVRNPRIDGEPKNSSR